MNPTQHADPNFWVGWLAASIGGYLTGMQTTEQLRKDYKAFLRSPLVGPELRAILPPAR